MNKLQQRLNVWIAEHPLVNRLLQWAKRVSFVGFEGVPLYYVARFFLSELKNERLSMHASSVAFYFLVATFPGLLFLITLIPYLPIADFNVVLMNALGTVLPAQAFSFLSDAINDIVNNARVDLLSIGFIFAFYFSTQGINALVKSFTRDQIIFRKRTWLQEKLTVIKLTAVLFLLLIVSVGFIILGNRLVGWITGSIEQVSNWEFFLISAVRWVMIIATFFGSISFIYYYAPATEKKWHFMNIGATVATIISITSSLVFSLIVNNFNLYNEVYGSIGAIIATITWIYINSIALIIGFELNLSVKYQKVVRARKQQMEEATQA